MNRLFGRRGAMLLMTFGVMILVLMRAGKADARGGLAAYHLHTGAYVTAARYEPVGSLLNVSNPRNGRSILVRVNDRGPFNGGRILDLSTGAFSRLFGGLGRGVGYVNYIVISRGATNTARRSNSRRSSSRRSGRKRAYKRTRRKTRR